MKHIVPQLLADVSLGNNFKKDWIQSENLYLMDFIDSNEFIRRHCFHSTHETPEWLCGAQSLHLPRGEWWLGGKTVLGWTLACWRLLIMSTERVVEASGESHQEASLGVFCWCDITLFPVMWVIPAVDTLAITEVSGMHFLHRRSLIMAFQRQVFCCHTSTDVCIDPVLHWLRS